ncbi:hypothetical protein KEJ21_00360 [Candidatus Bathyarchaeota archaeon]|nr:hypothetical protein [Candidatus Bathyarchaeota archaeon]MBS7630013.1 hypothetical protein [Candidatus Bathyarchaeota archaeon]
MRKVENILKRREKAVSPRRIVNENKSFISFVPFWAKWVYEISIYPKRHFNSLVEIEEDKKEDLATCSKLFYRRTIIFSDPDYL